MTPTVVRGLASRRFRLPLARAGAWLDDGRRLRRDLDETTLRGLGRDFEEAFLGPYGRLVRLARHAAVAAVGEQLPRLDVVRQARRQHFLDEPLLQLRGLHRKYHLDAAAQVAVHPVRRADIHLRIARIVKVEDAAMLEEAIDDAGDADVIADAGNLRPQGADAAANDVDLHARLAGAVQGLHDGRLQQAVDLGEDPCRLARPLAARLLLDLVDHEGLH